MSKLADLQEKLQRAILTGDDAILAELSASGTSTTRRLDVYAKGYAARLTVLLRADFPVLSAHMGEAAFAALAAAYARERPATHPAARYAGSGLADFLVTTGDALAPLLADIARIETALADAHDAADEPLMSEAALDIVLDGLFAGEASMRLKPDTSARRLDLQSNARAVWTAHRTGEPAPTLKAEAEHDSVLIWRFGDEPYLKPLAAEEARLWDAMVAGESFDGLLAHVGDGDGSTKDRLAAVLENWVAARLLAAPA